MKTRLLKLLPMLLAASLLVPRLATATVDTAWVRRYDGPRHGQDWATAIAVDSAGNVYVAGASAADTGYRNLDYVTIKYFPNGDTAWVRRRDFGGDDIPYGLGVDAAGNVYVTGSGSNRVCTVKYSPTGQLLWSLPFGSQGGGSDLALDAAGNVLLCGQLLDVPWKSLTMKVRPDGDTVWARTFSSPEGEDGATAVAVGRDGSVATAGFGAGAGTHYDCTTVMYDSTGQQCWAARYDGPNHGDDRAYDVALDDDGNSIAAGVSDNGYTTAYDYLAVKRGPTGDTLWTRRYNGLGDSRDVAEAVVVDDSGNAIVAGHSRGVSTGDDWATVKYGHAGNQLWVARLSGPGYGQDQARAVARDGTGNCYVTGSVWVEQAVGGDCVTAAYSPNGESLWCAFYNGPGDWSDVGRAIAVSEVGWVLVAGSSDGTGFNMDIMAIKYIQDGAVADQPRPRVVSALLTPEARPNPFSARTAINFQTPAGGETNVLVFDVAGRLVKVLVAGPLTAGVHVVGWNGSDSDGHPVPAGVYTVRLVTEQTKQSVKVVVLD